MIDNYDDYNFTHTVCVCVCHTHSVCVCVCVCVGGVPQSSCQGFSESSGSTPHKAGLHIIVTQQSKSEEEYETEDDTTITEVL